MRSKVVIAGFFALLVVGPAHAQILKAHIPFPFTAGEKALPPGEYQFKESDDTWKIAVHDSKGEQALLTIVTRLGGASEFKETSLVFDITGKSHILSEVWLSGRSGALVHVTPKEHEHEMLVVAPQGAPKLTGKDTFNRTCKRCHGANGQGDTAADQFFQKTIPRLSSEYVQSKSNAELTQIITHGRSDMPAVRLDKPGVGHLLPTESVEGVIAYVRTLKK